MTATLQTVRDKLALALNEANAANQPLAADKLQVAIAECDAILGAPIKYRNQSKYLFQTVLPDTPSRLDPAIYPAIPLINEFNPNVNAGKGLGATIMVTPTRIFIDKGAGWAWDQNGGDILDKNLVRNPAVSVPWFSITVPPSATPTVVQLDVSADVTAMQQFIQSNNRWNAISIGPSNQRWIAGKMSVTPPRIHVTYTDGTSEDLACRITAQNTSATAFPGSQAAEYLLGVFTEFEKPRSPVASAKLYLRVTRNSAGSVPITGNVIDPRLNTDPVQQGIAAGYVLDSGINGDPNIIGSHQYLDGTTFADFADLTNINIGAEVNYSPHLFAGRGGVVDTTKLPYRSLGKWIYNDNNSPATPYRNSYISVVPSTYQSNDGFKPLAPGVGALRVNMKSNPLFKHDGVFVGSSAPDSCVTSMKIFLPADLWGSKHLFIRYHIFIAAPNGMPYRMRSDDLYQVCTQPAVSPSPPVGTILQPSQMQRCDWSDHAGKTGIAADHWTTFGGTSGVAGGGRGWQSRDAWHDFVHNTDGPDIGGIGVAWHSYDFGNQQPAGYNYSIGDDKYKADTGYGQRGGLGGVLYAGQWYCIETELLLNDVVPGTWDHPGFIPNGEMRRWQDGRLVFERLGMVMRSLPMCYGETHTQGAYIDPGYVANHIRPTANLGLRSIWFNYFHGGITPNSWDRIIYIAQLVYAKQYIGPMRYA